MSIRVPHHFCRALCPSWQTRQWCKMRLQWRRLSSASGQIQFEPDFFKNNKESESTIYDLIIVGGGIVGITTARATLIERPDLKVAVLEKESDVAMHQSSHNSGVIHAGIYYKPGSLKAKFCVAGSRKTYEFCDAHNVPHQKCGKLIVATNEIEVYNLKRIFRTALANKAPDIQMIGPEKIREIEPHCQGLRAIHSPHTGIIDWGLFTKYCAIDFQERGGRIFCNFQVDKIREANEGSDSADVASNPVEFHDSRRQFVVRAKFGIACGGLYSDKLAEMAEGLQQPIIIPFRGEYLELKEEKRDLVRGNIYPVPDPRFPFLGVHFTPRLDGRILLGPNAVLALSREGYSWKDVNVKELWDTLSFSGSRILINKYGYFGFKEILRSFFTSLQVKQLQRYIPEITANDVEYKGFSGVRAQAVDDEGTLIDDLVLQLGTEGIDTRILHLRNAPSPAATSSLALSEYIAKSAIVEFDYDFQKQGI